MLDEAALAVIAACEAELKRTPDSTRVANLHYEIAQVSEELLGDLEAAIAHYTKAIERDPEHLPSIQGARRLLARGGRFRDAIPLFEKEVRASGDPRRKARLYYECARVFEERLGEGSRARESYAKAVDLDANNPTYLRALERLAREAKDWPNLARIDERTANAITSDARYRAALIARRARLLETHLDQHAKAAELYESALRVDPDTPGAVSALVRLYEERRNWDGLLSALERSVETLEDATEIAHTHYRIARIQWEHLGDRNAAIEALDKARSNAPGDPLVLEELSRLYRDAGHVDALPSVLRDLIRVSDSDTDRIVLWHTLGQVYEHDRNEEDEAIRCYRESLRIDSTSGPALQALGALLARREEWVALIEMHLSEAKATEDTTRRASAYTRVAEIFEARLHNSTEAASHHARAIDLVPGHPASFKALVRLYSRAGEHRKLIELFERAVDETPSVDRKIAYLFKIGALWEDALDEPGQAAHAYRRVLELRADDLGALCALQRVCERAGRYEELVEYLLREADLTGEDDVVVGLRHRAAVILDEHLEDMKAAEKLLVDVLERDPTFVPALANLGRIYYRAGRWRELVEMYTRELEVTEAGAARAALHCKIGELCEVRLGAVEEAVGHYRKAIEADASCSPATRALVRLLRDTGEYEDLARLLERRLEQLPTERARAVTLCRIAEICEIHLKDPKRAIEACRRAVAEDPEYRPPALALLRLLAATKAWPALLEHLGAQAESAEGTARAAELLLLCAEIARDHLGDTDAAIAFLESVRRQGPRTPALFALEPLYEEAGNAEALISVCAELVEELQDPAARLAMLRQIARIQARENLDDVRVRARTYQAILEIEPDDDHALWRMADLARASNDRQLLTEIYARLRDAAGNARLAADYWLRLAQTLEADGDERAIEAYRAGIEAEPQLLSAIIGFGRLARASNDADGMAEAARREAAVTNDPERSAELLVCSAVLRMDELKDFEGATEDLERALELWPDSESAAERIRDGRLAGGQRSWTVDLLGRAASSARQPDRKAALWRAVSEELAEQEDLGAAIAAVRRGLVASPHDLPSLRALADLQVRNEQWGEAISTLDFVIKAAPDREMKCSAYMDQARLWDTRLGKPDRAQASAAAALRLVPDHRPAQTLLAGLQVKTGHLSSARDTAQRLLDGARVDEERASALTLIASIARACGDSLVAEEKLVEAVVLEGGDGDAAAGLRVLLGETGNWQVFAGALNAHIERGGDGDKLRAGYQALADVCAGPMGLPGQAIDVLKTGLKKTGDRRLASSLVEMLHKTDRNDEAEIYLRRLIEESPDQPSHWRSMSRALRAMERDFEARLAVMPLVVLGAATKEEQALLRAEPARPASAPARSIGKAEVAAFAAEQAVDTAAAEVISAIADGLGKLWASDLRRLALSKRDRIAERSNHPLRPLVNRLCEIFAADCDFYESSRAGQPVELLLTEPISLVASDRLRNRPPAEQVFLLARPLGLVPARLHPVYALRGDTLTNVLVSLGDADARGRGARGRELEALANQIRKTVPRKWRRAFELASLHYGSAPLADVGRWRRAVLRTASRAAALVTDDLVAAARALPMIAEAGARNPSGSQADPADVADLLRFWLSEPAVSVRAKARLVPPRARTIV